MHQEDLNHASYAVRASPSKNSFPLLSSTNPFCHTCHTNQTLQMNLLSNYLPPSNDHMYQQLLGNMDAYKASLDVRYPPICSNCLPAVEEDIRRKDQMARSTALGGWLRKTKQRSVYPERRARTASVETRRDAYPPHQTAEVSYSGWRLWMWRFRAFAWILVAFTTLVVSFVDCRFLDLSWDTNRILRALSLVPIPWDPTIPRVENARLRGRQLEFQNRWVWTNYQWIQWVIRVGSLLTAHPDAKVLLLVTKLVLPVVALWSINLTERPRENRPFRSTPLVSHSIPGDPSLGTEDAVFSSLSLDPHPLRNSRPHSPSMDIEVNTMWRSSSLPLLTPTTTTTPPSFTHHSLPPPPVLPSKRRIVFGQTSGLESSSQQFGMSSNINPEDQMEWDPTPGRGNGCQGQDGEHQPYLRTQRFFPREQPTGLEGVWDSALRLDDLEKPKDEKGKHDDDGARGKGGMMGWLGWSKT
ncbi:hypothetical protein FRB94_007270 [Tulasnella sp. JGI-2019a]|nr:hypothetical protein FRB93_001635 [Tulasnella sp. JGI-2019a]KAG8997967.1 hypothetical protein FRB94_007270 [Tulasnella sp. JGI-2019a]